MFIVFFFCSHRSLVDVPLIFFCPADHVPDWQPRILLGMVEARSVNVKKTTTINYPKPALDLTNIVIIAMDKLWDRSPHQHTHVLEYVNS